MDGNPAATGTFSPTRAFACYALAGSLAALLGWALDAPALTDWLGTGISIQPNTTVAGFLAGTALVLLSLGRTRVAVWLGAAVALIGGSTLFQYASGVNLDGLNTLLMFGREWGRTGVLFPGRMGPAGALCWTVLGTAIALATAPPGSRARRAAALLPLVPLAITMLSFAGYLYRVDPLYTLPTLTVIALPTATFIAAVALGTMGLVREFPPMRWLAETSSASTVARTAVPVIVLLPLLLGWLRLQGENAGLYDARLGVAIAALVLITLLLALLGWSVAVIARHERAARVSEHRFREMIDALPAAVYTTDAQGYVTHFNPAAAELSGRSPELGSDRWCVSWKLYRADGTRLPHDECPMAVALKENRAIRGTELVVERPDGTRLWFEPYPTPMRDEQGRLVGGVNMLLDVTARKRGEQRLSEDLRAMTRLQLLSTRLVQSGDLHAMLREILAAAADFTGTDKGNIQILDHATGRLRLVVHQGFGPRFVQYFAHDGCTQICGRAARANVRVLIDDVLIEPELQGTTDLEVLLGEGIRSVQSTPLRSREGRLLGMLNNHFGTPGRPDERALRYIDLLGRMAADLIERSESEQALKDADLRKNHFLAILAHELRNPLAPIRTGVHLLRRAGGDAELVGSTSAMIERQVDHMVRLVDDLMDVSRITLDKLELQRERVELGAIVASAIEAVDANIQRLQHRLELALPQEPIWLHADRTRVTQVVSNLLSNACKFMQPGGRIVLSVERIGSEAEIRVRDFGFGIAADQLPRIFDKFIQVDTTLERSVGGLGIGLSLVKRLVEMHGGSVRAASSGLGHGSEFVLRLPVLEAAPASVAPAPANAALAPRNRRILIADDNEDGADSLAMLLQMYGHSTLLARDGEEAVALAARERPEVVLLDIGMPRLNGYEACERIRAEAWGREMVLVAVTGWGQDTDQRRSREAGFDAHLVKPVTIESVAEVLAIAPRGAPATEA